MSISIKKVLFGLLITLIFVAGLIMPTIDVKAEGSDETIALTQEATNKLGETDDGFVIYGSQDPNESPLLRSSTGNSGRSVEKYYNGQRSFTQIISITKDGMTRIGYCLRPDLNVPNGTDYTHEIMNNPTLKKVLYYGYGGNSSSEFMALEGGNEDNAYMDTWMAARYAYNGDASWAITDPAVAWLLNHAEAPAESFNVGNSPQNATWVPNPGLINDPNSNETGYQETNWYTTSGGGDFTVEVNNTGVGVKFDGDDNIYWTNTTKPTGTSFKLIGNAKKEGNVKVNISTTATGTAALMFIPTADPDTVQTVTSLFGGLDPVAPGVAEANFKYRPTKPVPDKLDTITQSNKPSGDAKLDGTKLALYRAVTNEKIAEAIVTDGKVDFPSVPLGKYYVKEISAGVGYTLSTDTYNMIFDQEKETYTVEVFNMPVRSEVNIKKFAQPGEDDPDGELKPLAGAEFTLELKADTAQKYVCVTDKDGNGNFGKIPFGKYTLKETKTPEGFITIADKDVEITTDGQTIHYDLSNKPLYAEVVITKTDKADGKPIALAGAKFKVIDLATNKFVEQYAPLNPIKITEWSTNGDGKLQLTRSLRYGHYALIETQAPVGYMSFEKSNPDAETFTVEGKQYKGVRFDITNATIKEIKIGDKTLYSYTQDLSDQAAKAKITVHKTGEMLVDSHTEKSQYGDVRKFDFDQRNLPGVTFEIKAVEDIKGPNASTTEERLYFHKGDVAAIITTGADGNAVTGELPFGKYVVVEKSGPEGYVIDKTEHPVELKYKGQDVNADANVEVQNISNKRQNAVFTVNKTEQAFKEYKIVDGKLVLVREEKGADGVVFGVYANENIKTVDGMAVANVNDLVSVGIVKNGTTSTTEALPNGKYYYKEIKSKDTLITDTNKYPVEFVSKGNDPVNTINMNEQNALKSLVKPENKVRVLNKEGKEITEYKGVVNGITVLVNENGELVNELYSKPFTFSKTEVSDGQPLPNTEVTIYDAKKNEIFKGKTDEKGDVKIDELVPGTYYYQESNAPEPYLVDDKLYEFTVKQDGTIVKANMTDELAMANIDLVKEANDLKNWKIKDNSVVYETIKLADAEFAVKAHTDITTPEGIVRAKAGDTIAVIKTDKNGKATVSEAYYMTKGAAIHREVGPVDLSTLKDKTFDPDVDATTPEEPAIKVVENDAKKEQNMIRVEENLFLGSYDIVETKAPVGYQLDPKVYNVDLKFVDSKTPVVHVDAVKPFDEATSSTVVLTKTDFVKDTITLPKTGVKLYDKDNKVIFEGRTDEKGNITINKLPAGEYYFQEFDAPEGYELDTTPVKFSITEHGKIVQCQMKDKQKPINPGTGTDYMNNGMMARIVIGFVALAGTVYLVQRKSKKNKQ